MKPQELFTLLKTSGLEVAYNHYDEKQVPPFVIYYLENMTPFIADDNNYYEDNRYTVYLVTNKKDTAKESILESIFHDNEIPFAKDETYIMSERIYQVEYSI